MASEPTGHPPMGADLLRQRRNLLVVSLALICVSLAGAEFGNKVGLMGTEITFARKWVLVAGAWVLWAYFFGRYLQYLGTEPQLGIDANVEKQLRAYHSKQMGHDPHLRISRVSLFDWTLMTGDYVPGDGSHLERAIALTRRERMLWTAKAYLAVSFKAPRVTDYVLPILIGLAAPLTAAFTRLFAS